MSSHLNTPRAVARLHELYSEIRGPTSGYLQIQLKRKFTRSARLLALLTTTKNNWFMQKMNFNVPHERVAALMKARADARAAKNWAEADRIRDELAAAGLSIKDEKDGTTIWEPKR
jgi:cysteinyl-tRNA synthetase